jgi:hypothetical protein
MNLLFYFTWVGGGKKLNLSSALVCVSLRQKEDAVHNSFFPVGAATCRDDRGWSLLRRSSFGYEGREPLPQERHFIADRTAPRALTRF